VAPGLPSEEIDQGADDQTSQGRDQQQEGPGEGLGHRQRIAGLRQQSLLEYGRGAVQTAEEEALEEPDHQTEDDRPEGAGQTAGDGDQHHEQVPAASPLGCRGRPFHSGSSPPCFARAS
jgi:hypothetical protein